MQNQPSILPLIDAIRATLDMQLLGTSLIAQRHFSERTGHPYIWDNTGRSLFIRVPRLPLSFSIPALSPLCLSLQQSVVLDNILNSQNVDASPLATVQVPLTTLINVWTVIANILQLSEITARPSKVRFLISLAFASILEEAYQLALCSSPAPTPDTIYRNSFALISPSHAIQPTSNLTPEDFYPSLLNSPCFPRGTADLFLQHHHSLLESLPSDPLFYNLPFAQPHSSFPCTVPAHRLCNNTHILQALSLAHETPSSLGCATFGAPSNQLSSLFPGITVLQLPDNHLARAHTFTVRP